MIGSAASPSLLVRDEEFGPGRSPSDDLRTVHAVQFLELAGLVRVEGVRQGVAAVGAVAMEATPITIANKDTLRLRSATNPADELGMAAGPRREAARDRDVREVWVDLTER